MDCMVDGIMPGQIHAYSIIPEVLIAAVFDGHVGFPPQRPSPKGEGQGVRLDVDHVQLG